MESGTNVIKSNTRRVQRLSQAVASCSQQVSAYGKCVTVRESIKQNDCIKEFTQLSECVRKAMESDNETVNGNASGPGAGAELDLFDLYFARAQLTSHAESLACDGDSYNQGDNPHTLINIQRCASSPRRTVSCKYPQRPAGSRRGTETSTAACPGQRQTPGSGTSSLSSSQAKLNDNSLCAPLLGAWISSRSAPHSRSSSWKKLKRPRSFRDMRGKNQEDESQTGSSGNLEEAIIDKLQQLKMLQEGDFCVVRSFSTSAKGIINKGDKLRRISNISPSHLPNSGFQDQNNGVIDRSPGAQSPYRHLPDVVCGSVPPHPALAPRICRVVVAGQRHVGKTALIQQFMTSQYMAAVGTSFDDEVDKTVSVLLDGEEMMLHFTDAGSTTVQESESWRTDLDAYIIVYSMTDHTSFTWALEFVCDLKSNLRSQFNPVIILVANKSDLVRTRVVSEAEGKCACTWLDCKYTEVSASLNHRVDELLVGIVRQIRLGFRKRSSAVSDVSAQSWVTRGLNDSVDSTLNCVKGAKEMLKELFNKSDFCVPPTSDCANLFV